MRFHKQQLPVAASRQSAALGEAEVSGALTRRRYNDLETVDPAWAWAPYEPAPDRPWDLTRAAHLFRRAGLGATWSELHQALGRGPGATIEALFTPAGSVAEFNAACDEREGAAARSGDAGAYAAWWLRRLLETPCALLEKTTLFWHDHFAIGASAAGDVQLFHRHVQGLRAGALGDVNGMLRALFDDPAMYVALGGAQNRRAQPNLEFAQRWLADFTVGPEAAREADVRGAAGALTGWFVYGGKLKFIAREQDPADKQILGRAGPLGREELVEVLANHPATARQIAAKLFRWFISETASPTAPLLEPLADRLRRKGGLRDAVETVLRSNLFFSRHALGQKIKSPVELAIGLARSLEKRPPTSLMVHDLANLGQRLDEPPTAHGWPTGADWINTLTIGPRLRLCRSLVGGGGGYGEGLNPSGLAGKHGRNTPAETASFYLDLLLQDQLPPAARAAIPRPVSDAQSSLAATRRLVAYIVCQPEYQIN